MYLPFPSYSNNSNSNTSDGTKSVTPLFSRPHPYVSTPITSNSGPVPPPLGARVISSPSINVPSPLTLPPSSSQPLEQHHHEQSYIQYQQQQQQHLHHLNHHLHLPLPHQQLSDVHSNAQAHTSQYQLDTHTHSHQQKLQPVSKDMKKKRGRPKKLIFDPSTNEYIDSSHPNYKQLNKVLKETNSSQISHSPINSFNQMSRNQDAISRLFDQPTNMRTLEDEAVQQLLQKKDRRGRPRKFPIEQTGLTIKGIRVNGTLKQRKKKEVELTDSYGQRITKKERRAPRSPSISSSSSETNSNLTKQSTPPTLQSMNNESLKPISTDLYNRMQDISKSQQEFNSNNKITHYSMNRDVSGNPFR